MSDSVYIIRSIVLSIVWVSVIAPTSIIGIMAIKKLKTFVADKTAARISLAQE